MHDLKHIFARHRSLLEINSFSPTVHQRHPAHPAQLIPAHQQSQSCQVIILFIALLVRLSLRPFLCQHHHWVLQRVYVLTAKCFIFPLQVKQVFWIWKYVHAIFGLFLCRWNFVELRDYHFLLQCVVYFLYELRLNEIAWPVLCPLLEIFLWSWCVSWQLHRNHLFYDVFSERLLKCLVDLLHELSLLFAQA